MATVEGVDTSSSKTSSKSKTVSSAIITKEEIQRFIDLGLGRGIDTTDPDLWRNKCSFVVRHATFDNVIGTDEGNLAEDYRQTVLSGNDLQQEFKESVIKAATTPIPIVLEAGASRSATSTRIVKGKRVVSRTASFNFSKQISSDKKPFEEVISRWLKKHDSMDKGCNEFIRYFGITHYVTSITLGASVHSIFTEEEHAQEVQKKKSKSAIKRKFKEAKDAVTTKLTMSDAVKEVKEVKEVITTKLASELNEDSSNQSRVRKLGVMNDNSVERGTTDEAVIGIRILPIHSLIEKKGLREALRKALVAYTTKNRGLSSTGPYIVECEDQGLYWKVNEEDNTLTATEVLHAASFFHIIPNEDMDDDPFDFYIGWEKTAATLTMSTTGSLRKRKSVTPEKTKDSVVRYLQVKEGSDSKDKIQMKTCVRGSTMSIYKPLIKDDDPTTRAELTQWLTKRRVYFIQSSKNNQYLSVQKTNEEEYQVKFIEGSQSHDEKTTWMLFRLLPINDDISSKAHPTGTL